MPTAKTIESLSSGDLFSLAIEPIHDKVSIYDAPAHYLKRFAQVNESQGLLFAANWCQVEVCNGGFQQFFMNSTGVVGPEAVRGFRMIGVPGASDVVQRTMSKLGKEYPRDKAIRNKAVWDIKGLKAEDEEWDPFESFDDEFYKFTGTGEFGDQADAFVKANLNLFFK